MTTVTVLFKFKAKNSRRAERQRGKPHAFIGSTRSGKFSNATGKLEIEKLHATDAQHQHVMAADRTVEVKSLLLQVKVDYVG
ncbi:hypothetical protein T11_7129 [Trichinella zimbabwensis]|uniref:Uncharacterized protein n=1 Tax=Trichinella zimbabwensis TaxID=268475 RepID=A0A0V1HZU6_9BILA|nr:hypothetical protein T11_7129 [Trichinella zimbabwensis]